MRPESSPQSSPQSRIYTVPLSQQQCLEALISKQNASQMLHFMLSGWIVRNNQENDGKVLIRNNNIVVRPLS